MVLGVEDVVLRQRVNPLVRSGLDLGLSNSGLKFGAAAASKVDSLQTAGATCLLYNMVGFILFLDRKV